MSLLSVDIRKVKRLSLKEVKLPAPELRVEPTLPTERPPTDEDIIYSKLVAINPTLDILINKLDLVSTITGDRLKKVKDIAKPDIKQEPKLRPKLDLIDIAHKAIGERRSLSKAKTIQGIAQVTNVGLDRAENGFNLMLENKIIEITNVETYYLTGSTPF